MKIKKFNQLTEEELKSIIEVHFSHWVKFSPKMIKENTIYKFTKLYRTDELPFGIALIDDKDNIVGFCVFKIENLKKYPEIFPWLSGVIIFEKYRGKRYGKVLLQCGEKILKEYGYNTIYVWTDQAPDFYKKLGFIYKQEVEKNEGGFGQLFYKNI